MCPVLLDLYTLLSNAATQTCTCVCISVCRGQILHVFAGEQECVWELTWHIQNHHTVQCGNTRKEHVETHRHTGSQYSLCTCIQDRPGVLVLMSPHCSFYQSNTHMHVHTHTDSINMESMKGPWCQATESGSFSPHTHTPWQYSLYLEMPFSLL